MNIIVCVCGFSLGCLGWGGRLDVKPKKEIRAIYCCEGKSRSCPSTISHVDTLVS